MRVAIMGAGSLAVMAARELIDRGHEVVIIDRDPAKIEELEESLDCGLIKGDGSRPSILKDLGPEGTDFLFCLSDSDEANVLGALVGRSLGFGCAVPMVGDPSLEPICTELGIEEVFVPDRAGAMRVCDLVEGRESPEITAVVRSGLRFLSYAVAEGGARDLAGLDLPDDARAIAYTRDEESRLVDGDTRLEAGDVVTLLVAEERFQELKERLARDGEA